MREITITANDAGRRLDRFLRKYLKNAALGDIYKYIRKDVKVDGRRRPESYMLSEGEILSLYLPDDLIDRLVARADMQTGTKRRFSILFEDDNLLAVSKPAGLLTHGDARNKKDHLANQVKDYLIAKGDYNPRMERVFSPAPSGRLDRNTSGVVLFGKNSESLRELNRASRDGDMGKYYLALACGIINERMLLGGLLAKDDSAAVTKVRILNTKRVLTDSGRGLPGIDDTNDASFDSGHTYPLSSDEEILPAENSLRIKEILTVVNPLQVYEYPGALLATLCEVELVTGRTHQIRAHLAGIGHPLAGDGKYSADFTDAGFSFHGNASGVDGTRLVSLRDVRRLNAYMSDSFSLDTQFLHASRVEFGNMHGVLSYLSGQVIEAPLPPKLSEILKGGTPHSDTSGKNAW